jgi:dihydrofolate synthase/folylpolyglutamate synthase
LSVDEFFFREWNNRRPGERRSLERAQALAARLGLPDLDMPLLAVVGSKGKGTCATFASAYLVAAGLRVVTITSPGFRTNRERIRVNGHAISEQELARWARRLETTARRLPRRVPGTGYLSPSGLFMVAGLLHARSVAADAVVVEAGRGGLSDEISLFPAHVVAITPVFGEHLGELGDSPADVARDKAGIVTTRTQAAISSPQEPKIERAIAEAVADHTANRLALEIINLRSSGVPDRVLSTGLNKVNAELGCVAAQQLLDVTAHTTPQREMITRVLSTVSLPGRLSWHTLPGTDTRILVDSPISRAATASALAIARMEFGSIDHVLLSLPDDKDLDGAIAELTGISVTFVRLRHSHLQFTRSVPSAWSIRESSDLSVDAVATLGQRLVALGTISLTARILDLVDADTKRLFEA